MAFADRLAGLSRDPGDRSESRVIVFTPSGVFEGDFRHLPGDPLSDAIRSSEGYILLTEVSIQLTTDIELAVQDAPFLLINTRHIDVILPKEQSERARRRESA